MAERTTERQTHRGGNEEYVEVTVVFHARAITFRIRKGATKKELWEAIRKKAEEEGIELGDPDLLTITIDSQVVKVNEITGTIKRVDELTGEEEEIQEETINENVVVIVTSNVEGGI